jgi:adenylosuccinate lyase
MAAESKSIPVQNIEAPYPVEQLMAITTLDGRYKKDVEDLRPHASEFGLIGARAEVEAHHLVLLSDFGVIRTLASGERKFLDNFGQSLTIPQAQRVKALEAISDHDVQAVEKMLREELAGTSMDDLIAFTHLFMTSEEDNNLAYRIMLKRGTDKILVPTVDTATDAIMDVAVHEKETRMPARTHGQKGVTTTVGKEMAIFAVRLNTQLRKLANMQLTGKFNGAVGNFNAHMYVRPDINWQKYAKKFVEDFGFEYNPFTTQINPYEDMIEVFNTYHRLNGVLLDADQDMWRYISDDWFAQQAVAGETGSSTMAQKINPIKFENSEGNLAMANGLFEIFSRKLSVSRLQRDLSDSTVVRNVPTAVGFTLLSFRNTVKGLGRIYPNHPVLQRAVESDWSVLTEAVQSKLRMKGRVDAYDMVKEKSRGKHIEGNNWSEWVDSLDADEEDKKEFKLLTPGDYVGIAPELVDQALEAIKESRKNN